MSFLIGWRLSQGHFLAYRNLLHQTSVPAPSSRRPTPTSGSAVSATEAMGSTGRNCIARCRPSGAILRHTSSASSSAPCCDWMANMGRGPSSPIWHGFLFVMRGKDYAVLDRPDGPGAALHLPPDAALQRRPESQVRAPSTTAPMCLWGLPGCAAASWWRPIQPAKKEPDRSSPARASSTNSSSPISRKRRSPPPMWWHCTCIVAPLNRSCR